MVISCFQKAFTCMFKQLRILGYSKKKNIHGLNPLIVSTLFIALTLLLAALARKIVKIIFGDDCSCSNCSFIRQLLYEFIATLELCACCFELIIVADNWGLSAYAIFLFLLTIWWSFKWEDASACPYNPIEEVLEGAKNVKTAILIVVSQVLAALVTFRYVQMLWSLELVETHRGKAFEECSADLQVDMLLGALIEASLTCLCRLISRTLSETQAKYSNVIDAFFGTMMVVLAFNFSGGYFNPALATSLKLGCRGNTFVEHMVVYWVGASMGSIISVFIFRTNAMQSYIKRIKPKEE